jgi:hypothetical protein
MLSDKEYMERVRLEREKDLVTLRLEMEKLKLESKKIAAEVAAAAEWNAKNSNRRA